MLRLEFLSGSFRVPFSHQKVHMLDEYWNIYALSCITPLFMTVLETCCWTWLLCATTYPLLHVCWYRLPPHEPKSSKVICSCYPSHTLRIRHILPKECIVYVPYLKRITTAYHITWNESSFMYVGDDDMPHYLRIERRIYNTCKFGTEAWDLKCQQ